MSEWIDTHIACPLCPSSDGYSVNDRGYGTCFSCGGKTHPKDSPKATNMNTKKAQDLLPTGVFKPLVKRKIDEEICKKFGYSIGEDAKGNVVQIAAYRDDTGHIIAQKLRYAGKDFRSTGDMKKAGMFGQHLWKTKGKRIVITEGEIDCLAYATVTNGTWPVVSVKSGAQSAKSDIKKSLEFLEGYESCIFLFDQDSVGIAAAHECAALLSPGKAYIATLPLKDAGEMLEKYMVKELLTAVYDAKAFRPDGIVSGADISMDDLLSVVKPGFSIPYPKLGAKLHGLRKRELTLMTAGSGIGKSTLAREIGYHLVKTHGLKIGNVFLEESYTKTAHGYIAIDNNVPLGTLREEPNCITPEAYQKSLDSVVKTQYFYDHFGSIDSENLISKLKFMATSLECDFIILDHISIVVSGQKSSGEGERKDIDLLMTALRGLVEQTGVGLIAITHLKRPDGGRKSYNEGGRVTLQDMRGSASLEQLSDNIIAVERDQQGDNPDQSRIRLLKNREFGDLGEADLNEFNTTTGRLLPAKEGGGPIIVSGGLDDFDDIPF